MIKTIAVIFCAAVSALITSCAQADTHDKARVIVLGMIHSRHVESEAYSLPHMKDVIRAIDPDIVLTEIPPDRLEQALTSFKQTGSIDEPRVQRFPEYTDALFPLTTELDFTILPAAGWTREMADFRSQALDKISKDPARADDWAAYQDGLTHMREAIGDRSDNPFFIHTDEYDAITKKGLSPYATLFANDLGIGDWETINAAHYALINDALNEYVKDGTTILITFGAGHKYWFLEQLSKRDDIVVVNPTPYFKKALEKSQVSETDTQQ